VLLNEGIWSCALQAERAFEEDARMDPARRIVVVAFSRSDSGELVPDMDAMKFETEALALEAARELAPLHLGVVAWARSACRHPGDYGAPMILFQSGEVPPIL
jgi:hypothetical protein